MELVPEAAPSEVDTSLSGSGAEPARPRFLPSALHELELGQDGSDDGEEDEDWEDEEGEDEDEDYEEVGAEEGAEETITWKEYIRWYTAYYLEGGVVTVLLLLASVFALYGSDLRLAYFEKEVDRAFEALSLVCLVLFLLEFLAGTWARDGYINSYFWYLDILATLSLVIDVPMIFDPLSNAITSTITGLRVQPSEEALIAGTQLGRFVRIVRMMRLIKFRRLARLVKYGWTMVKNKYRKEVLSRNAWQHPTTPYVVVATRELTSSKTGQVLNDQVTRQTITGILLFIVVFPFLNVDSKLGRRAYEYRTATEAVGLSLGGADAATLLVVRERLVTFWKVIKFHAPGIEIHNVQRLAYLRAREEIEAVLIFDPRGVREGYEVVFDIKNDSLLSARYSLILTSFVIVLLALSMYIFNRASNTFCIQPIESIMEMMRNFSNNPLDKMKARVMKTSKLAGDASQLVQSVAKITGLLQIGFGEAGAAIISKNLANRGEIDPMAAGRKMVGLFGFVVIFKFADTTEALREDVMLYVNRIAAIVHACVHEFAGAINKNIGEAFLMVWPIEHRTEKRSRLLARRSSGDTDAHYESYRPPSPMRSPRKGGQGNFAPNRRGSRGSSASFNPSSFAGNERRTSGVYPNSPRSSFAGNERRTSGVYTNSPRKQERRGSGEGALATSAKWTGDVSDKVVERRSSGFSMPYTMSRGISNYNNTPRDTPTPSTPPPHRQYSGGTLTAGTPGRQHPGGDVHTLLPSRSPSGTLLAGLSEEPESLCAENGESPGASIRHGSGSFKRGAFQSELGRGWSSTSPSGSLRAGGGDQNSSGETVRLSRGRRDSPGQSLKGWGEARDSLGGSSRTGGESRSSPEGSLRAGGEAMNSPGGSLRAGGESGDSPGGWTKVGEMSLSRRKSGLLRLRGGVRDSPGGSLRSPGVRFAETVEEASTVAGLGRQGSKSKLSSGSSSALSLPEVGAAESARVLSASLVLTSAPASVPYFAEAIDENERASASLRSSLSSLPVPPPVEVQRSSFSTPATTPRPFRLGPRVDIPPLPPDENGESERVYVMPAGPQSFTTADCAVAGFALCALLVKVNAQLQQLCENELLQQAHPGFSVDTGYGLHMGWAIEGAIGSDLKIDASYLSPNVNLASRLEAATKQYGVRLLLSEQVASIMSTKCRACLRKVDRVTVKGSARPLTLYTLDIAEDAHNFMLAQEIDPTMLPTNEDVAEREADIRRRIVAHREIEDDTREADEETLEAEADALEEVDKEARMFQRTAAVYELRRSTPPHFIALWDEALIRYFAGQWEEAFSLFAQGREILPDDGPTNTLMGYLERRECQAPAGWNGVRELTSK